MTTLDCPTADQLPAVLHNDQLDLFHCNAFVGVSSTQQSGFEGGFRSAWMALDPAGPNCPGGKYLLDNAGQPKKDSNGKPIVNPDCQYAQLIRDDAYLVVVFVSDDDDCSVDLSYSLAAETADEQAALKALLPAEDWEMCQRLGDKNGSNVRLAEGRCLYVKGKQQDPAAYKCPSDCASNDAACLADAAAHVAANALVDKRFAVVSDFVPLFKSLKADPTKVIVAAISGDSPAVAYKDGVALTDGSGKPVFDEAQKQVDAAVYYKSLLRNLAGKQSPYVCSGANGEAGYGSRYIEMAKQFGATGYFANLCGDDFSGILKDLATFLATRQ